MSAYLSVCLPILSVASLICVWITFSFIRKTKGLDAKWKRLFHKKHLGSFRLCFKKCTLFVGYDFFLCWKCAKFGASHCTFNVFPFFSSDIFCRHVQVQMGVKVSVWVGILMTNNDELQAPQRDATIIHVTTLNVIMTINPWLTLTSFMAWPHFSLVIFPHTYGAQTN